MTADRQRREMERWIAWIRLGAVPFAIFQVAVSTGYPRGYQTAAWATTVASVWTCRTKAPGIPVDDQKLIFEKFGRSATGGGAKPGTGLGLFIARSIVEAHGGVLEVESAPKQGSRFFLTLPI